MKTKLLKKVRKDRRFLISHKYYQPGYPYSGWWYMDDVRTYKSVKHKRLINVLHEYTKLLRTKNILLFFQYLFYAIGFVLFISLFRCTPKPVEPPQLYGIEKRQSDLTYLIETGMTPIQAEKYLDSINKK